MMKEEEALHCHHCGSDEGIFSTYWEERDCLYDWSGNFIESDNATGKLKYRKTGRCIRCRKYAKIPSMEHPQGE